jgi:hypothetical protein
MDGIDAILTARQRDGADVAFAAFDVLQVGIHDVMGESWSDRRSGSTAPALGVRDPAVRDSHAVRDLLAEMGNRAVPARQAGRLRVLLVDAEPRTLRSAGMAFGGQDCSTYAAWSHRQAARLLARHAFDLVVADREAAGSAE